METDKTIAQISEDLGFVEDSYFVRIFKQETGETPLNTVKERTEHKTTTPRSRCFTPLLLLWLMQQVQKAHYICRATK